GTRAKFSDGGALRSVEPARRWRNAERANTLVPGFSTKPAAEGRNMQQRRWTTEKVGAVVCAVLAALVAVGGGLYSLLVDGEPLAETIGWTFVAALFLAIIGAFFGGMAGKLLRSFSGDMLAYDDDTARSP